MGESRTDGIVPQPLKIRLGNPPGGGGGGDKGRVTRGGTFRLPVLVPNTSCSPAPLPATLRKQIPSRAKKHLLFTEAVPSLVLDGQSMAVFSNLCGILRFPTRCLSAGKLRPMQHAARLHMKHRSLCFCPMEATYPPCKAEELLICADQSGGNAWYKHKRNVVRPIAAVCLCVWPDTRLCGAECAVCGLPAVLVEPAEDRRQRGPGDQT